MRLYHMIIIASLTKPNLCRSYLVNNFYNIAKAHSARKRWCHQVYGQSRSGSNVCILSPENPEYKKISSEIANTLEVPLFPEEEEVDLSKDEFASYDNVIHFVPYKFQSLDTYAIGIQPTNNPSISKFKQNGRRQKNNKMQPLYIDFCPPSNSKMGKRIEKQGQRKGGESLLKATALNKMKESVDGVIVYDLNAGFGQDSIMLAMGGASKVYMVERDPIVGLLLSDAMRRLQLVSNLDYDEFDDQNNGAISRAKDLFTKLSLHLEDSVEFAKKTRQLVLSADGNSDVIRPDICYLDPMFPPRTKSSAVKKNMQILHGLFQHNDEDDRRQVDERKLLEEALLLAKSRVVVKRPINALPLGVHKDAAPDVKMPSYELRGSINRFDIYVI